MLELYIKIENNIPVEHPILGDNLRQFYPDLSDDNIPDGYVKFVRKPHPATTRFQKIVVGNYIWEGDVVTDNWIVEDMNAEEKASLIERIRNNQPFPSWTFDETNYVWNPPIPKPDDGNLYRWKEETQSWITRKIP